MSKEEPAQEKRIQYLEEQLSFLEHSNETRDRAMLEQTRELERLSRAVKVLGGQLKKIQESHEERGELPHEKPPHY